MSAPVIVGAAVLVAICAVCMAPLLPVLAGTGSRWFDRRLLLLLGALAGAGAGALATRPAELAGFAALGLGCVLLVVVDIVVHRLPDPVMAVTATALLAGLGVTTVTTGDLASGGRALAAAATLGAGFLVLALISPASLGLGDVKLAALLGAFLGWLGWTQVLIGVVASFLLGGTVALVLLISGRVRSDTALAFGPWMVMGAVVGAASWLTAW